MVCVCVMWFFHFGQAELHTSYNKFQNVNDRFVKHIKIYNIFNIAIFFVQWKFSNNLTNYSYSYMYSIINKKTVFHHANCLNLNCFYSKIYNIFYISKIKLYYFIMKVFFLSFFYNIFILHILISHLNASRKNIYKTHEIFFLFTSL